MPVSNNHALHDKVSYLYIKILIKNFRKLDNLQHIKVGIVSLPSTFLSYNHHYSHP